jgi:serine phosphatase RsbU (regulator of sigma subunit)
MKKLIFALFLLSTTNLFAATNNINIQDSLKKIEKTNDYKIKIATYVNIADYYNYLKGDTAMFYYTKAEKLSLENKYFNLMPDIYQGGASVLNTVIGNYPLALYYSFQYLKYVNLNIENGIIIEDSLKLSWKEFANWSIATSYAFLGNIKKAKEYIEKTGTKDGPKAFNDYLKKNKVPENYRLMANGIWAQFFVLINEYDIALKYNEEVRWHNDSLRFEKKWSAPYIVYADILSKKGKYKEAIESYKFSIPLAENFKFYKDILEANYGVAINYFNINQIDSSIKYATKVVQMSSEITFNEGLLKANQLLYKAYKLTHNQDSAFKYLEATEVLRDEIFNNIRANDAQNMAINEEVKQAELADQRAKQQKILILTALALILFAIGIYLNGKRKQKNRLRKIEEDRKNGELKAARDLQLSMLPKELPKRTDLDIATFIRSSTEVGGDYYDFFPQPEGNLYSICGDATGHGVTSGMMVSVAKAGLNGIGPIKPNKILQKLNGVVKRIDLGTLRMSMNIAEITNDEVFLSSAAMPPIYLYKAATKQVEEFMNNGLPLGGLRDEEFILETRAFEPGDVLVQLSDGLPEAPNSKGEMYDYDQLKNLIQASCHLSSQEIIDTLIKSVDQWMEGQNNPDDITLVVTKKK